MPVDILAATQAGLAPLCKKLATLPLLLQYQVTQEQLCRMLLGGLERQEIVLLASIARGLPPCALIWGQARGAMARGAYLRLLLVAHDAAGQGVGTRLLQAFEKACEAPPGGIFVTTQAHEGSAAYYARHGYRPVGPLPDFVRAGRTELLLWKRS